MSLNRLRTFAQRYQTGALEGHTDTVWGCAIAPDGSCIVSASADGTLRLWDPFTHQTTRTLDEHTREVRGCSFAFDGTYIVSASADKTLRLWR